VDDKLLILRAFSTLNQVRDAKVPELNLLPGFHELIEDLRIRLGAPEPEPVAWRYTIGQSTHPAEWLVSIKQPNLIYSTEDGGIRIDSGEPLYTAPPQRKWQGLTDKERNDCLVEADPCEALLDHEAHELMRTVEAKLKEKNT
jgi:hypothetical protein